MKFQPEGQRALLATKGFFEQGNRSQEGLSASDNGSLSPARGGGMIFVRSMCGNWKLNRWRFSRCARTQVTQCKSLRNIEESKSMLRFGGTQ